MGKLTKAQIMARLDECDDLFAKAQIITGDGSRDRVDRKGWAGSKFEEVDMDDSTPDGTNYKPSRKPSRSVNKSTALQDFDVNELERELRLRKSGVPNPTLAEMEILGTLGDNVEKSLCLECNGAHALVKGGYCGMCHNLGFVFAVDEKHPDVDEHIAVIKSIQARHNVDKLTEEFYKSQNKHKETVEDEEDTTPTRKDYRGVKEDKTGEIVKKANEVASQLERTASELEDVPDLKDDAAKNKGRGINDEDDDEDDENDENIGNPAEFKSVKKSVRHLRKAQAVMARAIGQVVQQQALLVKSLVLNTAMVGEQGLALVDVGERIEQLISHGDDVAKSLETVMGDRRPARAPKSANSVSVMRKGFVDQAPSQPERTGNKDDGYQPRYGMADIMKASAEMVIQKSLSQDAGMKITSGYPPDMKTWRKIDAWIDANGVPED